MELHLNGSTKIRARREEVFRLVTDPNFIASALPDAEDVAILDKDSLEAKLRVKVALVSSTIKVRLTISDRTSPSRARLLAEGSGSGSSMKINSTFELSGDGSTTMSWAADAEITGLMAGLGSTFLRGLAEKKVAEIFEGITRAVEAKAK